MKVGIRFSDNDFTSHVRAFIEIFIIPTFKDIGNGHMVTHLTTQQIVDQFNLHCKYLYRYTQWYNGSEWDFKHNKPKLHECELSDWLMITHSDVYWDDRTDRFILDWNGNNNCEFTWTDGKRVYIT